VDGGGFYLRAGFLKKEGGGEEKKQKGFRKFLKSKRETKNPTTEFIVKTSPWDQL